jgi:positive regulator of sigma E activity
VNRHLLVLDHRRLFVFTSCGSTGVAESCGSSWCDDFLQQQQGHRLSRVSACVGQEVAVGHRHPYCATIASLVFVAAILFLIFYLWQLS